MPRFSIKAMAFVTALVATYCGVVVATLRSDPRWAIVPYAIYGCLIIGWCVYREINEDKP
jgi:hypothetical protein